MKTLVFATSFVVSLCATHVAASSDQTNSFGKKLISKSAKAGASFNRGEARQGHVLADILRDRDIKSVAVTYSNTPYGISLETAFSTAFRAQGGTIAISISHQDGKTDYFAEMGALAVAGVEHLVVFGHLDRGGEGILRTALDTGAFEKFVLGDAMVGDALVQAIGDELAGSIATLPGAAPSEVITAPIDEADKIDGAKTLVEPTPTGNFSAAVDALKSGASPVVDSAGDVKLTGMSDATGTYRELEFIDGRFETVKIH